MKAKRTDINEFAETETAFDEPKQSSESSDTEKDLDAIVSELDALGGNTTRRSAAVNLPPDMLINVKSMTYGGLIYVSRTTNQPFTWNDIGDVRAMTVAQIVEMNNSNMNYLHKPRVVLTNKDAIKYFGLEELYSNIAKLNCLEDLFKKSLKEVSASIDLALSVNLRDIYIAKTRTMYKNGTLTDINVIRLLEDKLKFALSES